MVGSLIKEIEEQGFSELFSKDGRTKVVAFYEANSGTCEMMEPVMESASIEFKDKVQFYRMDVSVNENFIIQYHIHRRPFFMVIKGDEITDIMAGLVSMRRFLRIIQMNIG